MDLRARIPGEPVRPVAPVRPVWPVKPLGPRGPLTTFVRLAVAWLSADDTA